MVAGERGKGVPPLPALVVGLWALLYTTLAWVAMISLMFWDFFGKVGGEGDAAGCGTSGATC